MKKLGFLLLGFLLSIQVLAAPASSGFTDNFTVNLPTFNGRAVNFQMVGQSDKHSGLEFQNGGCTTNSTGTQCHFNIWDKGNGWLDTGNTIVVLSALPKSYMCQLVIYDGSTVLNPSLANVNCTPGTLHANMSQQTGYNYNINITNN